MIGVFWIFPFLWMALGANIMGVITSAIIAAIYVTVVPML